MRRQVKSPFADTALSVEVRARHASIRTLSGSACDPVHVRIRRGAATYRSNSMMLPAGNRFLGRLAVTRTGHPQDTCYQCSRVFRLSPLHYNTFIILPLMPPMAVFASVRISNRYATTHATAPPACEPPPPRPAFWRFFLRAASISVRRFANHSPARMAPECNGRYRPGAAADTHPHAW